MWSKNGSHRSSGQPWLGLWHLACVLVPFLALPVSLGFNLELESSMIFTDPTVGEQFWGRDSYFGFSVAIHKNQRDSASLVVGAPRANSSHYLPSRIKEPGVLFKCNLQRPQDSCKELFIDQEANLFNPYGNYHDYKNGGWLGAALDSQPTRKSNRQVTAVCAPRWRNKFYSTQDMMNGVCYWLNDSLPDAPAHKMLPLSDLSHQIASLDNQNLYYFTHGQAGISIHFPDEHKEMVIGAPGVFNWQGSIIRLTDSNQRIFGTFRRRTTRPENMFATQLVPNPYYTSAIQDFALNGYAVSSGRFFDEDKLLYVSGAPRGANMYGQVVIFDFPTRESSSLRIWVEWKGSQLGENFGASLVSGDINGDGFSDLVVGSPTYSGTNKPDMGRIQVFTSLSFGSENSIAKTGERYGSKAPQARFGTTLGSPGDINQDGYEDIAVGTPWEDDGSGAVYIYLGSSFGLKKEFAQRLTPLEIPNAINLKGFGISLSRGIDIDDNSYPDLAIGSFISGHTVVLKSRTVGSISGYMTSDPPALQLETKSFELVACISYGGFKVPRQVDVIGNISLDYGHPSPRASFADSDLTINDFSIPALKRNTQCMNYSINLQANKIDIRRPILVRLTWEIQDKPGQRLSQPIINPAAAKSTTLSLPILTDCNDDGDNICTTDMHVEASFKNYGKDDQLVIGSDKPPILDITVINSGESVFQPNVTIQVPKPFALFMPNTHSCDFTIEDSRSELVCQLVNPISKDVKDKIEVTIDTSQVKDNSKELTVEVKVTGEGVEMDPSDNIMAQKLQLTADIELQLRGYSRGDQIYYQRLDEDTVNTTIATSTFTHYYSLVKSGSTPLERVDFELNVPVNFTEDINFITLYTPKTSFMGQTFLCSVEGAALAIEKQENGESGFVPNLQPNEPQPTPPPRKSEDDIIINWPEWTARDKQSGNSSLYQIKEFRCPSPQVSCAKLRCRINSWPGGTNSAEFSIKMDVNLKTLAALMYAQAGAIISSTATASMVSLNPDIDYKGNTNLTTTADTKYLPLALAERGIPWWIILVAVLCGLLLLIILAFALYKLGFFKRKQRDEMKAQQAQVKSQSGYGALQEE